MCRSGRARRTGYEGRGEWEGGGVPRTRKWNSEGPSGEVEGMETLIPEGAAETLDKIKPTDPLRLAKQKARRN